MADEHLLACDLKINSKDASRIKIQTKDISGETVWELSP